MKVKTHRICGNSNCSKEFKLFKTTDKYCSIDCMKACVKPKLQKQPNLRLKEMKPFKPIKKVSDKRKIENAKYIVQRIEFLSRTENEICFIEGCGKPSTTIEHTKGRQGYADEFARENNITLFLDERFWKGCCLKHNLELETNTELSKKYQKSKIHNGSK